MEFKIISSTSGDMRRNWMYPNIPTNISTWTIFEQIVKKALGKYKPFFPSKVYL